MTSGKSTSFITTCFLTLLIVVCFYKSHGPRSEKYFTNELEWDVFSYYMYLPFTFIYDDIGMQHHEVVDTIFKRYKLPGTYYQAYPLENGNYTPNYTMGFALLWSPFFFIGHWWAKAAGYPVDGWSFPYQFSIASGVLIYILIGLLFLRKILLRFFSDKMSAMIMLLIVLGTNYFHETFHDTMQPHAQVFTGYAMLIWFTIRWHEEQKKKFMMMAGLVMGLMILARPSEILCIIIPVLWNVYDKESLKRKIELIRSNFSQCLLLVAFAFIPFIPQIMYWKYVTGSWIFFSYQHTEGFDFLKPHILKVLFSFKKSWFVYTPIIIFPIMGIILLWKYNRKIFFPFFLFFLANFYLLSSWAAWWNGGSFGMRYFVDSYPVMAVSFGYVLVDIQKRKWFLKTIAYSALTFFVFLNLFQTWQYVSSIIPDDRMTFAYYKAIFFKTKVSDEERKLMEVERSHEGTEEFKNPEEYRHRTVGYFDFDGTNSDFIDENKCDSTHRFNGTHAYKMTGDDEWGPEVQIQYDQLVPKNRDHAWLRVTVNYFTDDDIRDNPASLVINMPHKKYNLKYRAFDFEKYPSKKGAWNKLVFDYMTPYPYSAQDHFDVYIWHRGKKTIWFDDFRIEAYLKK